MSTFIRIQGRRLCINPAHVRVVEHYDTPAKGDKPPHYVLVLWFDGVPGGGHSALDTTLRFDFLTKGERDRVLEDIGCG